MKTVEQKTIVLDIVGCARCHGGGHDGLEFRRLTHPLDAGEYHFTHWAMCPLILEPILLTIMDKEDDEA